MQKYFTLLFLFVSFQLKAQNITTIAGNGWWSWSGDGGAASLSQIFHPGGIVIDGSGNLFFADQNNNRVRKITPAGIISTVAGSGEAGYSGDGGAATLAKMNFAAGLAIDATGNLYIADRDGNRIRKVTTGGIISTVAGNGTPAYFGDNGAATNAFLRSPSGVAVDASGNIYIADMQNNAVRMVNTAGIIRTICGSSTPGYSGDGGAATLARLNQPAGINMDATGNIFIADSKNGSIRKINTSGIISTVVGKGTLGSGGDNGPATAAQLNLPNAVKVDAAGNIFISDNENVSIRKVNTAGIITTIAGTGYEAYSGDGGPATDAQMYSPEGVCNDAAGNVYFSDGVNNRIRKINTAGIISSYAGSTGVTYPATNNSINPYGIVADQTGNIYITDADNNRVCKVDPTGNITTIIGFGTASPHSHGGPANLDRLKHPSGISRDAAGNIYIVDEDNQVVRKLTPAGVLSIIAGTGVTGYNGDGIAATSAQLFVPTGVAVDAGGNVYIADKQNHRIRKIDNAGIISTVAGNGAFGYSGDGSPATAAQINSPSGVAFDYNGNMYIADGSNYAIRKVSTAGIISTIAGQGTAGNTGSGGPATAAKIGTPYSVAVDSNLNIFFADDNYQICRKINALGIITSIAGTAPLRGFSGDGGPATASQLNAPRGIATDNNGAIYICDYDNYRIRKIDPVSLTPISGTKMICIATTGTLSNAMAGGTWTSSNATVATIGSTSGTVTGVSAGTSTIIYELGGNTVVTTVTIVPLPTLAGITGATDVCVSATTALTNATPGGTWSQANSTASVAGGIVMGVSAGTNTISYAITAMCGTAIATKTMTIKPLPSAGTITGAAMACTGASTALTNATTGGTWASSSTVIATIAVGTVTGISTGSATISYTTTNTCGSTTATKTITVSTLPLAGTITGVTTVCEAATTTLTNTTTGGIWTSSSTAATVAGGVVTGINTGTTTISYAITNTCGATTAIKTLTINPLPVAGAIMGATVVCIGSPATLTNMTTGGTWSTANTTAVMTGSVVNGLVPGTNTISYTVTNGCGMATALMNVTISPLPPNLPITGPASVCEGSTITLTNATAGGTWSTSSMAIATISGGMLTGVSPGTIEVGYVLTNACSTIFRIITTTVTVLPLADAGTINGPLTICEGDATTLTNTITGGVWTSSNNTVASISAGGVLSGITEGSATITYSATNSCGTVTAEHAILINGRPLPITGNMSVCAGSTARLSNATTGGTWSSGNAAIVIITTNMGEVTSLMAGTSTITYKLPTGCFNTNIFTANPLPTITGNTIVCVDAITALTDVLTGGKWYTDNIYRASIDSMSGIVTGISAGYANITYILPTGCRSAKEININPLPNAGTISGAAEVCLNSMIVLHRTTAGGIWSSKKLLTTVSTDGSITGITPGTDTVLYSLTNSCGTSVASLPLTVAKCDTAIPPVAIKGLDIYPNPTREYFTMMLQSPNREMANVSIMDVLGRPVRKFGLETNTPSVVDMGQNLAPGMYLISVMTSEGHYERKIIIAH